jgi:hypothetical protein
VPATTGAESEQPAATADVHRVDEARVQYLEIAAFRIAGLLQLRNVRVAHEELSRLGSLHDLPLWRGDTWGTAVALRVIEAEVKSAVGQRRQAVDLLYVLLSSVRSLLASLERVDAGGVGAGGGGAKEKEQLGEDAGLALLQTAGAGSTALLVQQERAVIAALVSQHIESGDYASARALLEPRRDARGTVASGGDGWHAAFGWALVRLHVHFGSLPAAEEALATCEERDPEAAKGDALPVYLPVFSSLPLPPFLSVSCSPPPLFSCIFLKEGGLVVVLVVGGGREREMRSRERAVREGKRANAKEQEREGGRELSVCGSW